MQISDAKWKVKMIIGYARVSTAGQTLDDQVGVLRTAGAVKVYQEKVSGARSDRPQLTRALTALKAGDVLMVTRLDRLARSTRDLLNILAAVSDAGASFRSIADAWVDTTNPTGRLMLTVLGGLAEFERSLIKARCDTGIARARAACVKFGRKPKLSPYQRQEAIASPGRRRGAGRHCAHVWRRSATISRLRA
jgi:DNA invertase Pin-like site-specific DNA recombinase